MSDLETTDTSKKEEVKITESIEKPKKKRELTEKQKETVKANLEKGRLRRQEQVAEKQKEKEKEANEKARIEELKQKKKTKAEIKREKMLKELEELENSDTQSDTSEEIIIVKKKKSSLSNPKPKKEVTLPCEKQMTSKKSIKSKPIEKPQIIREKIKEPDFSNMFL